MHTALSGLRLMGLLVLCSLILGAMVLAGRAGVASLYYFPAAFALQQWQQPGSGNVATRPDAAQLARVQHQLAQAVALQPHNPHYLLSLAKVNEWAWYSGELSSTQLQQNEALYRQAIALRPDWPVAYADFAYFRVLVQGRLSDGWDLLQQAAARGPYLPEVQQKWLIIAFSQWPQLSVAQKAQSWQRVELGMRGALRAGTLAQIRAFAMQRQSCLYLSRRLAAAADWPAIRPAVCP